MSSDAEAGHRGGENERHERLADIAPLFEPAAVGPSSAVTDCGRAPSTRAKIRDREAVLGAQALGHE
jgi:hypothetical protein